LQAFKDVTLFCLLDSATLASVIPVMDKLGQLLTSAVLRKDKSKVLLTAPVKTALLAAKCTLNCYYATTNNLHVYRLAMILHPQYKLVYFKQHGW
ncbi:hypothetical protein BT96DRAFT_756527, partial [Gymnopus androsaceus JB14]